MEKNNKSVFVVIYRNISGAWIPFKAYNNYKRIIENAIDDFKAGFPLEWDTYLDYHGYTERDAREKFLKNGYLVSLLSIESIDFDDGE